MAIIDPRHPAAAALALACGPLDPQLADIADQAGTRFRADFDRLSRRPLAVLERVPDYSHEWDVVAIDDDGGLTTIGCAVDHVSRDLGSDIVRHADGAALLAWAKDRYDIPAETRRLIAELG